MFINKVKFNIGFGENSENTYIDIDKFSTGPLTESEVYNLRCQLGIKMSTSFFRNVEQIEQFIRIYLTSINKNNAGMVLRPGVGWVKEIEDKIKIVSTMEIRTENITSSVAADITHCNSRGPALITVLFEKVGVLLINGIQMTTEPVQECGPYELGFGDIYEFKSTIKQAILEFKQQKKISSNIIAVDKGALTMALNVLKRANKNEVAKALEDSVIEII